jgi:hypothetical protein
MNYIVKKEWFIEWTLPPFRRCEVEIHEGIIDCGAEVKGSGRSCGVFPIA